MGFHYRFRDRVFTLSDMLRGPRRHRNQVHGHCRGPWMEQTAAETEMVGE